MSKILEGIRVLDFGRFIAAPFCGMMLADMGAEVIKIEDAKGGDPGRTVSPLKEGESLYVHTFNRNKKGLAINLRSDEGKHILQELVKKSDIIIQNFRPGVMEKMGLSWSNIQELNSKIILVSISGFGQDGPYSQRVAFDWIIQAMSGFMSMTGTQETGPAVAGTAICDHLAGLYSAYCIMLALYNRDRTGKGLHIDIALFDCLISIMQMNLPNYAAFGLVPEQTGGRDPYICPSNTYKTKNGYIFMHAGFNQHYSILVDIIKSPILSEEKYKDTDTRLNNHEIIDNEISKWMSQFTSEEAEKLLLENSIPASSVCKIQDLLDNPQLKYRKKIANIEIPGFGEVPFHGFAPTIIDYPEIDYIRAPKLGEHTHEILSNVLGLDYEKIQEYHRKHIL